MITKVFHGSTVKIDKIDLSICRSHRDFGRGFYVTKFRQHAENWALNMSRRFKTQGIVNEFEYGDNDFTRYICKIRKFDDYSEEWLDFVVMCRNEENPEPAHDYDIVEGPVADDKVQNRINDYLRGKISKANFLEELKYHEQTHQICFCTLNSLQCIKRMDDGPTFDIVDIVEPVLEKLMLDRGLDEEQATDMIYTSGTFARLSDESTGLYRQTWEEIYEMLKSELKM